MFDARSPSTRARGEGAQATTGRARQVPLSGAARQDRVLDRRRQGSFASRRALISSIPTRICGTEPVSCSHIILPTLSVIFALAQKDGYERFFAKAKNLTCSFFRIYHQISLKIVHNRYFAPKPSHSAVKPPLTCTQPGCHPERRRREPPQSKDPVQRQQQALSVGTARDPSTRFARSG